VPYRRFTFFQRLFLLSEGEGAGSTRQRRVDHERSSGQSVGSPYRPAAALSGRPLRTSRFPRIVARIQIIEAERAGSRWPGEIFAGPRPMEMGRIAGQHVDAPGWISRHTLDVEPIAQSDVENPDVTV
jgi:hypothetical protein